MDITYLNHNCVMISDKKNSLIIDPHDDIDIKLKDDFKIVFTNEINESSFNSPHRNSKGSFDIQIEEIPSYCDDLKGQKRGANKILLINFEKFKLCHLGQLGHIPSMEILNKIKNVDLLMIPIGGNFTIDYRKASYICKESSPKNILPMNYRDKNKFFPLKCIDKFLLEMKNIEIFTSNSFTFDTLFLNNDKKVLILSD